MNQLRPDTNGEIIDRKTHQELDTQVGRKENSKWRHQKGMNS